MQEIRKEVAKRGFIGLKVENIVRGADEWTGFVRVLDDIERNDGMKSEFSLLSDKNPEDVTWWDYKKFCKVVKTIKNMAEKHNFRQEMLDNLEGLEKSPNLTDTNDFITQNHIIECAPHTISHFTRHFWASSAKNEGMQNPESPLYKGDLQVGSKDAMGEVDPKRDLNPLVSDKCGSSTEGCGVEPHYPCLPMKQGVKAQIQTYLPLQEVSYGSKTTSLVIGVDTEYKALPDYVDKTGNQHQLDIPISYQGSIHLDNYIIEFIFIPTDLDFSKPRYMTLDLFLGVILSFLGFRSARYSSLPDENNRSDNENEEGYTPTLPITLVSHNGIVDISKLETHGTIVLKKYRDENGEYQETRDRFVSYLGQVQGGLCTTQGEIIYDIGYNDHFKHRMVLPISLSIRDTMGHSVNGKSLADIGNFLELMKIKIKQEHYKAMDDLLINNPSLFFEYAQRDADICVIYPGILYGYNKPMPLTLMSALTLVAKETHKNFINRDSNIRNKVNGYFEDGDYNVRLFDDDDGSITDSFYYFYLRGVIPVSKGKKEKQKNSYITTLYNEEKQQFTSAWSDRCTSIACSAFAGGLNEALVYGWYDCHTIDIDLEAAYASVMTDLYDVDFTSEPLYASVQRHTYHTYEEAEHDIWGCTKLGVLPPNWPIFASISYFSFPEDTYKPCIPIQEDGTLVYPLKSKRYISITGPELYLALKMGATVTVDEVYVLPVHMNGFTPTHHFGNMLLLFLKKRLEAQKEYGKKSTIDLLLKLACNSLFGKASQGIRKSSVFDGIDMETDELGVSPITSPIYASMITGIIRTILITTINEIHKKGYRVFSVTTDGFITDAPFEFVDNLDLNGFASIYRASHQLADGKSVMWSVKHEQDYLFQWCTRLNIGFDQNKKHTGKQVYAKASYKDTNDYSSYAEEDIPDIEALEYLRQMVNGVVIVKGQRRQTNVRDWQERNVFPHSFEQDRTLRQNPDYKRKVGVLTEVDLDFRDVKGRVACFDTLPYKSMKEYYEYRKVVVNTKQGIRTAQDIKKIEISTKTKTVDGNALKMRKSNSLKKEQLKLLLMGYFTHQIEIPKLSGLTQSGLSKMFTELLEDEKFTVQDVKNCRNRSRQKVISKGLFIELEDTLKLLGGGKLKRTE